MGWHKFNDETPMPFGKHKGKPLAEVPANYLLWLWDQWDDIRNGHKPHTSLSEYILENLDVLQKEVDESFQK